ncbi:MAG: hypothetical protein HY314_14045 [Acidobacteria bacterium]|nr:hypothetical protein [Acidobacteriota bacterium]
MSTYYILRKANGEILTIDVEGKTYIPVWDSESAVRRSKRANPDLIVYVPVQLDRRWIERRFSNLQVPFLLVDSRDPDLQTGREIDPAELFEQPELARAA